jgi:hypothetical protein
MSPCLKMAADFNLLGPKNGLDFGVHFQTLNADPTVEEVIRNFPIRQPVLWL